MLYQNFTTYVLHCRALGVKVKVVTRTETSIHPAMHCIAVKNVDLRPKVLCPIRLL